ncbi:carboxylesterase/lipase family protein [Saccharopolyspora sp. CA-218241]|uniref:carboxylesterase/lipase family protein n=1 Tax=Saccharopolyspora sp. CA-218241 TaxID=3240027 RepID=UPI003D982207
MIVELDSGRVRGRVADEHVLFQGIPYAAPPVGELRWRSPQPVEPWSHVRDATEPGCPCPQIAQSFAGVASENEDCLVLDVTAPRTPGRKPVLVWLHGGGGTNGAGALFDAHRLAVDEDVVVVTPNSRLGVFGFFGHPALPGGGAYGIEDQQAALRWVRRNIAAFGGDPDRVMLFGESYGGLSTTAHLVAPGSVGLLHRAAVQSGFPLMRPPAGTFGPFQPALDSMWMPTAELDRVGAQIADELGWTRPDDPDAADRLRRVPVTELLGVSSVFTRPAWGGPVLPVAPDEAVRAGRVADVPVLVGGTRDEARLFVALFYEEITEQSYGELLAEAFGPDADEVRARYPAAESPGLSWARVLSDGAWAASCWELMHALSAATTTFGYEFADRDAPPIVPFPPGFPPGAHHSAEVVYQFDLGEPAPLTDAQWRLAATMNRYWARFARTGDPGDNGLPAWPAFTPERPHVQSLRPDRIGPADFAADHRLDFWSRR